jgi:L-fuconate dehydratase
MFYEGRAERLFLRSGGLSIALLLTSTESAGTVLSTIKSVTSFDVRFPTSLELDGSDAVNVDPDYSAAYVVVTTSAGETGHGLVFTAGRGNEIVCRAIESYGDIIAGLETDTLINDLGSASARLIHDSQMRWLGPEKGVTQMAAGAVISALWDIKAKRANKPLWKLLAEMTPEEIVSTIDFTHIRDALTPDEALEILREGEKGKDKRIQELSDNGHPAYTTTPGWLGYSDEKMVRLAKEAIADGFGMIKLKVGGNLDDDIRRMRIAREAVGEDIPIAIDANQRWERQDAIDWVTALAPFNPFWIEEATSTDDILGHAEIRRAVAPVKVATGEAVMNRIVFKQLLESQAIDVLQLDATRVAGVNENLAILLMAKKFGVPVCPHAGGVGLCELVQHYSFFDYAALTGEIGWKRIEYVGHLHEHFVEPAVVENGHYVAPRLPGTGAEMLPESRQRWLYPDGAGWAELRQQGKV